MIYLDNAATTSPKPPSVISAVSRSLSQFSANPGRGGHTASILAAEQVFSCRTRLAEFFGSSPERVIFTSSCTAAVNTVLKGLLKSGDHVICSSLEHNAVMRPLHALSKKGIQYDIARIFPEDFNATLNAFEALIKSNTKLIICTHASNVFGTVLPIEKIGEMCSQYGILFAVDGAQTAGVLNINTRKMKIDYLCLAPHKGLYAPMGTGVLIANSDLPQTLIEGGTGTNSLELTQPELMPERFESGTVNLPGIFGIKAGLDFVEAKNPAKIYSNEMQLITGCYDQLNKIKGIKLYTPRPRLGFYVPVLSFNFGDIPSEAVAAMLNEKEIATRAGFHCAPRAHKMYGTVKTGTVRLSVSAFTTQNQINYLVNCLRSLKI